MVGVPALGMRDDDPAQDFGEFAILPWPEKKMPVIGHETVGGNPEARASMRFIQDLLKGEIVRGLLKQGQSPNPAVQDMVGKGSSSQSGTAEHVGASNKVAAPLPRKTPDPFFSLHHH